MAFTLFEGSGGGFGTSWLRSCSLKRSAFLVNMLSSTSGALLGLGGDLGVGLELAIGTAAMGNKGWPEAFEEVVIVVVVGSVAKREPLDSRGGTAIRAMTFRTSWWTMLASMPLNSGSWLLAEDLPRDS